MGGSVYLIKASIITIAAINNFSQIILVRWMISGMVVSPQPLEDSHDRTAKPTEDPNGDRRLGEQALDRTRGAVPRAADDGARRDDRERRAAIDPARTALRAGQPHLG